MGPNEGAAPSDKELVVAFQRGDRSAFDEIFRRYHSRVLGICHRILADRGDAEEAAQETFLRAYRALGRFNGSYLVSAWLSRIATNVCVDQIRSKARTNLVALPDDAEDLARTGGPEDVVVGDHPRLDVALGSVQPMHATALKLRAVEGMSHEEIAGRLALSAPQVKALLHRARHSVRRAWNQAENWALVPVFGLKRFLDGRGGPESRFDLMGLGQMASPGVAERLAASVVLITAAAVSVGPALPGNDASRQRGSRTAVHGTETVEPRTALVAGSPKAPPKAEVAPPEQTGGETLDLPAVALQVVEETAKKQTDERDGGNRNADDEENPVVGGANGVVAEADRQKRYVEKIIDELD